MWVYGGRWEEEVVPNEYFNKACSFNKFVAIKIAVVWRDDSSDLFAAGVLGDSLGSLGNGMLGKLTRQEKTDSSLDFSRRDGLSAVDGSETRGLSSNPFEEIVDEWVHYGHRLLGDTNIWVDLLQNSVDVGSISLLSRPPSYNLGSSFPRACSCSSFSSHN